MYHAKGLNGMTVGTMTFKGGVMSRRDVPEHIREAAYIMQGVFARLAERMDEDESEKVVWADEEEEARACCR